MRASACDRARELFGDQVEKPSVLIIERTPGAQTDDRQGVQSFLPDTSHRHHRTLAQRLGPRPARQRPEPLRRQVDDVDPSTSEDLANRPTA
jgi:hypothetical protein